MEVAYLVRSVYDVGKEIWTLCEMVQINENACRSLSKRVLGIHDCIKHLKNEDVMYLSLLEDLFKICGNAKDFVAKFTIKKDTSKTNAIFHKMNLMRTAKEDAKTFDEFNQQLCRASQDLNLGIQVHSLNQSVEDCEDNKKDMEEMRSLLSSMHGEVKLNNELLVEWNDVNTTLTELYDSWKAGDEKLHHLQQQFASFKNSNKHDAQCVIQEMKQLRNQIEDMKMTGDASPQQDSLLRHIGIELTSEIHKIPGNVKAILAPDFQNLEGCILASRDAQSQQNDAVVKLLQQLMKNQLSNRNERNLRAEFLNELIKLSSNLTLSDKKIGQGGFGQVFVGHSGGKEVAVKVVHHSNSTVEKEALENEALFMAACSHSSVLQVFEIAHLPRKTLIAMELASRGTLSSLVLNKTSFPDIPMSLMLWWLIDVASALVYIHSKKVVHFDVKPDNVLLTDRCRCKLTDFGLAKQQTSSVMGMQSKTGGTFVYMGPEVLQKKGGNHRSDVYSLGVLSVATLRREVPSLADDIHKLVTSLLESLPSACSCKEPLREFFENVLEHVSCRISAVEAHASLCAMGHEAGGDPRNYFRSHADKNAVKSIDSVAHSLFVDSTDGGDEVHSAEDSSSSSKAKNLEVIRSFYNWFLEADIAPDHADRYARELLKRGIPSIKKFSRVVKSKGIKSFNFNELDEEDILDALGKEESFQDDVKPADNSTMQRRFFEPSLRDRVKPADKKDQRRAFEIDSFFKPLLQNSFVIDPQDVKLGDLIGRGGFSVVYKGEWNSQQVAVKITASEASEIYGGMKLLGDLRHPNVIQLHGVAMRGDAQSMLVMELGQKGSLYSHLQQMRDRKEDFPWRERLRMAHELSAGLEYMHRKGVIHQDIKSLNVVLDECYHAKWCDIGLDHVMATGSGSDESLVAPRDALTMTTGSAGGGCRGTLRWMAPEQISHRSSPTEESNVWSLGMVFFEIASQTIPYAGHNQGVIRGFVESGEGETVPKDCEENAPVLAGLMRWCWAERSARPSAAEIAKELRESAAGATASLSQQKKALADKLQAVKHQFSSDHGTMDKFSMSNFGVTQAAKDQRRLDKSWRPSFIGSVEAWFRETRRECSFLVSVRALGSDSWTIKKNFNEFKSLRESLQSYSSGTDILFPRQHNSFFSISDEAAEKQKEELSTYLTSVCICSTVMTSDQGYLAVKSFLCVDEHMGKQSDRHED